MNIIVKTALRFVGKISKLDTNAVFFKSYNGDYSDSPRYIAEEIHRLCPEKKIVWSLSNLENPSVPDYVIKVAAGSKDEIILSYKAGAIVSNVYGEKEQYLKSGNVVSKILFKFKTFLNYKKGQHIYTTWHGTPLKKMGVDIEGSKIRDFSCPNTTMFVDNDYLKKIIDRLTFGKLDFIECGSPRMEYIKRHKGDIDLIKEKLGLPRSKKIALFCPTFRTDTNEEKSIERSGLDQLKMIDIPRLQKTLKKKFGGDWVLVCRFHYHVANLVDWSSLDKDIYNGNKSEEMSDYLLCSDLLITDISSCMFEASLSDIPTFLLFPDLNYYSNTERGLYVPIKVLPYSCAINFNELLDNIDNYNQQKYKQSVKDFLKDKLFVDDNKPIEKIARIITGEVKQ